MNIFHLTSLNGNYFFMKFLLSLADSIGLLSKLQKERNFRGKTSSEVIAPKFAVDFEKIGVLNKTSAYFNAAAESLTMLEYVKQEKCPKPLFLEKAIFID